ncbi:MAG: DUF3352 domain-containing protein, partial [Actinomycetota bacterium]|nr:DUF3352 domain-containing protein [Actinomycetota bacterium]
MLSRARVLALVLAVAAALAISACGGGGGVSSDDPASLAPADAPVYIQATIRPHGATKTNVESLASTISGFGDPTGKLIDLVDESLRQNHPLNGEHQTFEKDFEPWLGDRAGVFVEGFTENPPAAAIVQTTDAEATQKSIDDSKEKGDKDRSYKGVDYLVDGTDGTAAGVVGDFLVVGNEQAFKDAVDVSKGGDSLGDQSDFTDTLDRAPSGSLADAYVSLQQVTDTLRAQDPSNAKVVEGSIGDTSGKTVLASLVPAKDSLELDLATNANQSFQLSDVSKLIETFPADSFVAVGIPDLGATVTKTIDQLEKSGVAGISRAAIDQQLSSAGLSLDDITSALGDLGIFAEGTDKASLQGAGVITSKSSSNVKNLIGIVSGLATASGQPGVSRAQVGTGFRVTDPQQIGRQSLTVTSSGAKIVIGYGDQATRQALSSGGSTLAEDPTYKQAVAALGGNGLSGFVSLAKVFQLADALGAIRDPGYQQARPYLDKLNYAAIGSGK